MDPVALKAAVLALGGDEQDYELVKDVDVDEAPAISSAGNVDVRQNAFHIHVLRSPSMCTEEAQQGLGQDAEISRPEPEFWHGYTR